jgi:acyl carrier protein
MKEITLGEFIDLIETYVGGPGEEDFDGSVIDVLFEHLGYESLALLELVSQVKHQYGVDLSEDSLGDMKSLTPRQVLGQINEIINSADLGERPAKEEKSMAANKGDAKPNPTINVIPDHVRAWQVTLLASAGRLSRVVHVLAELGVADVLEDGPLPVGTIAGKTGAHEESLYRILRCAASLGVFAEGPERVFGMTELADGLRSANAFGVLPMVGYNDMEMTARPFEDILNSVRTGAPAFEKAHGMPLSEYFERHPEARTFFDDFMAFWSRQFIAGSPDVDRLDQYGSIADLGGGDGFFLAQLLRRNPKMKGYLLDYPDAVAKSGPIFTQHGVADRVTVEGGDLDTAPIPGSYDAYLFKGVLHWMSDEAAEDVLRKVRAAIGNTDARLLVIDWVLRPGNDWDHFKFLDIDMLVLYGGRERTLEDWTRLLEHTGFTLLKGPWLSHWQMPLLECKAV